MHDLGRRLLLARGVNATSVARLLRAAEATGRAGGEFRATAIATRSCQFGHAPHAVLGPLPRFSACQDSVLHAEQHRETAGPEFAAYAGIPPGGHLPALARVNASEYGPNSAGYEQRKTVFEVYYPRRSLRGIGRLGLCPADDAQRGLPLESVRTGEHGRVLVIDRQPRRETKVISGY